MIPDRPPKSSFSLARRVRGERGVTSTDVVLVIGLIALVASLLWPRQKVARLVEVEADLAAWLVSTGERLEAGKAAAIRDLDGDGIGEYPALTELDSLELESLPDGQGHVRNGYYVVLLRPDRRFQAARSSTDPVAPGQAAPVDPLLIDAQEASCVLMAWPVERGDSGMRAYCWTPADGLLKHTVDGYPYDDAPPPFRGPIVEREDGQLRAAKYQGGFWLHPPVPR